MKIKRRLNWVIWRNKILALATVIILIVLWYLFYPIHFTHWAEKLINKLPINLKNPVVSGLVGAFIGGVFPIIGGFYTQARQFKIKGIVARKNVIYSPLFDELVKLKKSVPENGEYPSQIVFGKREKYHSREVLNFDAWERIKSDTRYIEVPTYLKKELNEFQQSGEIYMELRTKACQELYEQIRPIAQGNVDSYLLDTYRGGLSWNFLDSLLTNKEITEEDIQRSFHIGKEEELNNKLKECLNTCRSLPSVENVKLQYTDFQLRLNELINSTHRMIDYVQRKYEHKSRSI